MAERYQEEFISCRPGCGACCLVISISSPIPGMPEGKPAGVRCIHLSKTGLCELFEKPERPAICSSFRAEKAICGSSAIEAIRNIALLEGLNPEDFYYK
jgi:Fe-S-cluster containining protein